MTEENDGRKERQRSERPRERQRSERRRRESYGRSDARSSEVWPELWSLEVVGELDARLERVRD